MAEPGSGPLSIRFEIPQPLIEEIAARAAAIVQRDHPRESERGEWMNVREAADYLRCTPQRIYELRSDGRLPQTKEGNRALIRRTDLDGLINTARR